MGRTFSLYMDSLYIKVKGQSRHLKWKENDVGEIRAKRKCTQLSYHIMSMAFIGYTVFMWPLLTTRTHYPVFCNSEYTWQLYCCTNLLFLVVEANDNLHLPRHDAVLFLKLFRFNRGVFQYLCPVKRQELL